MGLRAARNGEISDKTLRRFARKCESEQGLMEVMSVLCADHFAHPGVSREEVMKLVDRISVLTIEERNITKAQRIVTGHDIMEVFGIEPGPEVGLYLAKAQAICDERPGLNKTQVLHRMILDDSTE